MEGCSSMSPWTNIYRQAGLATPGTISMLMDPTIQAVHSKQPQEPGEIISSWCNDHHRLPIIDQCDPFDASSIDQSLECLLSSGTNSNTETNSSDNNMNDDDNNYNNNNNNNNNNNSSSKYFWDFSSINNNNQNNEIWTTKKRSHKTNTMNQTTTSPPPQKYNKRQRCDTNANKSSINSSTSNISFRQGNSNNSSISLVDEADAEAIQQMKEMIYRAAAFRPVNFGLDQIERPKRRNVRISNDPQTAAARQRREKISERLRVLQKLVPGGTKMDTASMLDEAANYLKFLRNQVKDLENFGNKFRQVHHNGVIGGSSHVNLQFSPPIGMAFPMQIPQFLPSGNHTS